MPPYLQDIYNALGERRHQIEAVNRHGGQYIREAKVRFPPFALALLPLLMPDVLNMLYLFY